MNMKDFMEKQHQRPLLSRKLKQMPRKLRIRPRRRKKPLKLPKRKLMRRKQPLSK